MVRAVVIRPVEERDLEAWIALWNATHFWPWDRETLLFRDAQRPAGEPALRLGAWWADSRLVALAEVAGPEDARIPGTAWGTVAVVPDCRRQGLGTELASEVEQFARESGLERLLAEAIDRDMESAGPFLARHGFGELEREQTSVQEPAAVDVSPVEALRERLSRAGIETTAFSAVDAGDVRRELWRTWCALDHDMPTPLEFEDLGFEEFVRYRFGHPGMLPDALFVARDGPRIVGISGLQRRPGGDAEVSITGVLTQYRRRGIARVLKLMATRCAREHGFLRVYTDNSIVNAGMLALNRELGFRAGPCVITLQKRL